MKRSVLIQSDDLLRVRGMIEYQRGVVIRDYRINLHNNHNEQKTIQYAREFIETLDALARVESEINDAMGREEGRVENATS
jgi:hypothetical protein